MAIAGVFEFKFLIQLARGLIGLGINGLMLVFECLNDIFPDSMGILPQSRSIGYSVDSWCSIHPALLEASDQSWAFANLGLNKSY